MSHRGGGGGGGLVVGQTTESGFLLVGQSAHWNIWAVASFYTEYKSTNIGTARDPLLPFNSAALGWPEQVTTALDNDFDYTIFPIPAGGGYSYDGVHMDAVLDPASQGGAHTGTVFGSYGVSVSPDAIYNPYTFDGVDVEQFWWYIFLSHETCNVFTGAVAQDWIWADGSSLWTLPGQTSGESPFPNMMDILLSKQAGLTSGTKNVSGAQASRFTTDPGVQLFLNIQSQYGWKVFQKLFAYTIDQGIKNWGTYTEPLRTAILIWFLSKAAGLKTSNTTLLTQFNAVTTAISGQTVPLVTYQQAQTMFPNP